MALITCSKILIVCVVAIIIQFLLSSSSSPGYLDPPSSLLTPQSNSKLQEAIKLGEGLLKQPEDIAFDKNGVMYTVTRDGSVKKLHKNGTWEKFCQIESESLLGITITAAGDLIVCDGEEFVTRFADDVIEASDGMLYFSDASTKHSFHDWRLDLLEGEPNGRLLKYDPSSNETSIVLEALAFANGVAVSADQHYLVVCETLKYRCLKYWLQGDNKGQTEIFIDNLPGMPDNINLAPDSSFWIALLQIVPTWPRIAYTSPALKYAMGILSNKLGIPVINIGKKAMVVNVGSDGTMRRGFNDPTGKVMRFVTSVVEFEGNLYFGSLYNDFVGKLTLTPSPYASK